MTEVLDKNDNERPRRFFSPWIIVFVGAGILLIVIVYGAWKANVNNRKSQIEEAYKALEEKLDSASRVVDEMNRMNDTTQNQFDFSKIEPLENPQGDSLSLDSMIKAYNEAELKNIREQTR